MFLQHGIHCFYPVNRKNGMSNYLGNPKINDFIWIKFLLFPYTIYLPSLCCNDENESFRCLSSILYVIVYYNCNLDNIIPMHISFGNCYMLFAKAWSAAVNCRTNCKNPIACFHALVSIKVYFHFCSHGGITPTFYLLHILKNIYEHNHKSPFTRRALCGLHNAAPAPM